LAGRKTFVAGEILTAADVNAFLMDQAVQVYDSAAARTTALPSPLEGQVTYLKDVDRVEVYTTAWGPIGKILDSKTAIKTDTQVSSSIAAGASVAVSGLTIAHSVQSSSNKVLLFAQVNTSRGGAVGAAALTAGGTAIGIGDAASSRTRMGASNLATADYVGSVFLMAEHTPGVTTSVTYGVNVINLRGSTDTLYVNRTVNDTNNAEYGRGASVLTLMEVAA
jgi:hypothetical protein